MRSSNWEAFLIDRMMQRRLEEGGSFTVRTSGLLIVPICRHEKQFWCRLWLVQGSQARACQNGQANRLNMTATAFCEPFRLDDGCWRPLCSYKH